MNGDTRVSHGAGVVVLAAYQPDPELFGVQLRSIRDQTRRDFRCLVGADGGQDEVRRLVDEVVGDDPRFEVIGWDDNVGFYLNFERLLMSVPDDATWVALSDQDDRWYPEKLERLVPLLDDAALATGQARIITWPDQRVVVGRTDRRVVAARDLLVQNQVTGSQTVLRRELIDTALPFPRLPTVTQLHDHWLAMCAVAVGGYVVLDEVVQDYVQHGANLVGEVRGRHARSPWRTARLLRELADEYEGGHSAGQIVAAAHTAGVGWRRLMARELAHRTTSPVARDLVRLIGSPGLVSSSRAVSSVLRSSDVTTGTAMTLVAGLPGEVMASRRYRHGDTRQAGTDPEETVVTTENITDAACWLCGAPATRNTPYAGVGYAKCTRCGFLFQPDRGSAETEAALYDSEYFDGYDQRTGGRVSGTGNYDLATAQRENEARVRVQYMTRFTPPRGSLLEIGAASGYFVDAAARAGFRASGIEPSAETAADARARGIPVRGATLADVAAEGQQFDAVCAWHVLEHLPQPREAIQQVRSLLRPGGWLVLELPNVESVASRRGGVRWAHLDADAHVAHYRPEHVRELLHVGGFDIVNLETFSIRTFSTRPVRRFLHALYDAVVLWTPARVHPTRHELLRVAARRPVSDS